MFENLKKQDDVVEEGDRIFGSVLPTGVYNFTIDMAYVDQSEGGAAFMQLSLISDEGKTLSQRIFFTSGDEKGNAITYPVKKNGKPTGEKKYLPGFILASDLHEVVTMGTPLAEMETEGKLVNAYSPEAKKEVPTQKQVVPALLKQKVKLGVQEQLVFKTVNQDGKYVETTETRSQNEIVKVFSSETNQTRDELANSVDPVFMDQWVASYAGKVVDKTKGKGKQASPEEEKAAPSKKKMFG